MYLIKRSEDNTTHQFFGKLPLIDHQGSDLPLAVMARIACSRQSASGSNWRPRAVASFCSPLMRNGYYTVISGPCVRWTHCFGLFLEKIGQKTSWISLTLHLENSWHSAMDGKIYPVSI